jgi:hypothetical protein
MTLVSDGREAHPWDQVMYQIARWTLRHLNSPRLLLWFASRGGKVAPTLARMIADALKSAGPTVTPPMRTLWSLMLAGRIR